MRRPTWEEVRQREAENNERRERYHEASQRARELPIPRLEARGPFSNGNADLPGEYVINPDGKTITWYAYNFPKDGGWVSGAMVSAMTPENIRTLEEAGYVPGSWEGVNILRIHTDSQAAIQKLLDRAA
jgi:hypothetical protein